MTGPAILKIEDENKQIVIEKDSGSKHERSLSPNAGSKGKHVAYLIILINNS